MSYVNTTERERESKNNLLITHSYKYIFIYVNIIFNSANNSIMKSRRFFSPPVTID